MIPDTVRPMKEPMRTLVLQGIKMTGSQNPDDVLVSIEEQLTGPEVNKVTKFLTWLTENKLTVGHGTISLRWDEFIGKRTPASQEEAYQWAMKKAGL